MPLNIQLTAIDKMLRQHYQTSLTFHLLDFYVDGQYSLEDKYFYNS